MRKILISILLVVAPAARAEPTVDTFRFRELDGPTQHLYVATCQSSGGKATCSLRTMSVSSSKSTRACMIAYDNLFEYAEAQKPSPGTYIVSRSAGLCGYTNTYTFSATGMVQVKSAPAKPASNMCEAFAPKTYQAAPETATHGFFQKVPIGDCSEMQITL